MAIKFPTDAPTVDTTIVTQGNSAVSSVGGAEKYNKIDGDIITVSNVVAKSVTSDWVYAGNISAGQIQAGSLNSGVIVTSNLSANQITTGSLSADRISGGSLIVGGSSDSLGVIIVKNNSGTEVVKINRSGFIARNQQGLFFESVSAGDYFSISNNGSSQAILRMPNSNQFFLVDSAGTTNLFTVSTTTTFSEHYYSSHDNYIKLNDKNLSLADNDVSIFHDGSGGRNREVIQWGSGADIGIDNSGAWFHINGTDKEAIVPTSKGFNALYCIEAPEVWFMDFCYATKKRHWPKFWEYDWKLKPDSMFVEVTEGEVFVVPTGQKNIVQIWRRRKGYADKRFGKKTKEEFDKNEEFLRQSKV